MAYQSEGGETTLELPVPGESGNDTTERPCRTNSPAARDVCGGRAVCRSLHERETNLSVLRSRTSNGTS